MKRLSLLQLRAAKSTQNNPLLAITKPLAAIGLICFTAFSHSAILPGDIIISEVMANPAAVSDTNGEWFELFNASSKTLDINGLQLSDDGSNSHTINQDNPFLFNPGDYLVLGRNQDTSANGGLIVNYSYTNFTLSNSTDAIRLSFDNLVISELSYTSGSDFGTAGQSMTYSLSGYSLTSAELTYGLGDIGTPGSGDLSTITGAEVPIPGAAWLFASSLGLLIKRKRDTRV